jgi:two-component system, OmpR family, sensor histidine kinase KdpD
MNTMSTNTPKTTISTTAANAQDRPAAARDRLLVVLGSSDSDLDLIYASMRFAEALNADWTVVHVQTSPFRFLPDRDRDHRLEVVRIAESLGGEAVMLQGGRATQTIAIYARLRQASKVVVGSPTHVNWQAITHYIRVATLKRHAPGVEIVAIAPRSRTEPQYQRARPLRTAAQSRPSSNWRNYILGLGVTAVCTALAFPISTYVDLINIVMVYMLGAATAGLWLGRGPSTLAAVTNILAFDFFFVPPRFSLLVLDRSYIVTFTVMLLVALVISNLMIAIRHQKEAAAAREQHASALYAIARELAVTRDAQSMAKVAVRRIEEDLQSCAFILLCDEDGQLNTIPVSAGDSGGTPFDINAAQWVAANRQRAGFGTRQFPEEHAFYLPLAGAHAVLGVMIVDRVEEAGLLPPEQYRLLEAFAGQLASALERARLTDLAHAAHVAAERASMRNTLLASISHDLRTPLSAIAGAGSMMAQNDFALDIYRRVTLGHLIEDKARDMSDLLSKVLELVRLESGADVLNQDWYPLADLVNLAIQRNQSRLTGWIVTTDLSDNLSMLWVDATLFVQLLANLLENATKYTPPGTRIAISAVQDDDMMRLVVEDNGPGWAVECPERLFEKFTRGRAESTVGGVGLGLAICRAVARLHGGDIKAAVSREGGARFEIHIPLPAEQSRRSTAIDDA